MIKSFPKIFTLGDRWTNGIWDKDVEVTEKVDGSFFAFGKIDGKLFMRSKGKEIVIDNPEKMFSKAVDYVLSIEDRLFDNTVCYCEYLQKPKHNTLTYDRVPKNNLMLFGVYTIDGATNTWFFIHDYNTLQWYSSLLRIEPIPLLIKGPIYGVTQVMEFLEKDSVLGGCKIEGIVMKNYNKSVMVGDQPMPILCAKLVSEKFKEKHKNEWPKTSGKSKFEEYAETYRTEARWQKAVQHLKEKGELAESSTDIGKLLKEVNQDILAEETENIKDELFKLFYKDILRRATAGLPEWYKEQLRETV